jgi:acyl dehydratase
MNNLRYFEDFAVGDTFETVTQTISHEEAVSFAKAYDPQDFHTDAIKALEHPVFQGLSLSGLLTMSITHRLIVTQGLNMAWGLVGKGIDQLRWFHPVRPGDTLRVRGRILDVAANPSKGVGTQEVLIETINQLGQVVLSFVVTIVVPSRSRALSGRTAA